MGTTKAKAGDPKDELLAILNTWTSPSCWRCALGQADECRKVRNDASRNHGHAREALVKTKIKGTSKADAERLRHEADFWSKEAKMQEETAETLRQIVIAHGNDLNRAALLLADIAPALVEALPAVEFFGEPQPDAERMAAKVRRVVAELLKPSDKTEADDNQMVQNIFEAIRDRVMRGEEIAKAAGYDYSGTFKATLAMLKSQNRLVAGAANGRGYKRPK